MSTGSDKTEQPTQRRKNKAREEGQFVTSRELISSLQLIAFLLIAGAWGASWFQTTSNVLAHYLSRISQQSVSISSAQALMVGLCAESIFPLLIAGGMLVVATVGLHLATTGMGYSFKRLTPNIQKFNPVKRLTDTLKSSLASSISAALLLVVFAASIYWLVTTQMDAVVAIALTGLGSGIARVADMSMDLMWKGAGVLLLMGIIDFVRQFKRHSKTLRMSKQEIRDEMKEMDGNPLIKMRIRRLQREMRRNRMMKAVESASVVIVNPTHFAVALFYEHGKTGAPRVVAKGRGLIALKIKEIASRYQVPIVENPPLARALYKSVELSQEISPTLYRAVAEVLAYVHRLAKRAQPSG